MQRLAARQRLLIRADQLAQLGFSRSGVRHRVGAHRLHRVHRGVYAVHGPPYSRRQLLLAATFVCGPASAISDWAAASHLGIAEGPSRPIEVTSPSGAGRGAKGLVIHRRDLPRCDVLRRHGIPTTTAARTIVDLAPWTDLEGAEELIWAADSLRTLNRRRLEQLADRRRGRPGIGNILVLINDDPAELRSVNELRLRSICREFAVPMPLCNHRIRVAGRIFIADFCWPERRLIVEADSWRWHGGRLATERDRDRDQLLSIAGWRVVHFTRDQIRNRRGETGRRLAALTSAPGRSGPI